MTQTPVKNLTFEDYVTYDDGTDNIYELVDGKLVMVPLPTADHRDTIDLLLDVFREQIRRYRQPWKAKDKAGVYTGKHPVTGKDRSRTPDVCVMTAAQWAELKADKRSAAVLKTPPLLVVEVVSPGSKKIDYEQKLAEYKAIKIPEYWIVDLRNSQVCVLLLTETGYKTTVFTGYQRIISPTFPELALTASQLLSA
ncbi:MAG: Uma2 family endonuclease [Coleofasciculus sp. C1-SOL-03]|jgi:Uma2 family endonuclease|uniref:Uma2 family endonuclease n=1 Tax=Coleofasciculus sp. C1-SOL-03 TaxID=3069522 RepID=UPI0032FD270D